VTLYDRLVATSFRGPGFDHVRLAAATIVVLHHCSGLQYSDVADDLLMHYSAGFMDFGRFAVVVFFAISGFLVTPSLLRTANVVDYFAHRVVRIFPGLIANVVLTMFVLGPILTTDTLGSYFEDSHTYLYAKNILTLMVNYLPGVVARDGSPASVNGALWTLHFELISYIVLGLLAGVGILKRRGVMLMLWSGFYATYIAIETFPTFAAIFSGRFLVFVSLFVYFGSGVLLQIFSARVPFSALLALAAFAVLLAALPLGAGALAMPICLPYLMMFCGLSALPGKMPIKHDLSYGVYLIHAPVLLAFSLAYPNMHVWWVGALVVWLITATLAYVSWIFVEKPALGKKKAVSAWARRCIEIILPQPRNQLGRQPSGE
jgi:peptidoglycan/LPS O-acetylase OafA/YrhL